MGITTRRRAGQLLTWGTVLAAIVASVLTGTPAAAAVPGAAAGPVEPNYHCQGFVWENPDQGAIRAFDCRRRAPADLPDPIYVRVPGHTFLCSGGGHSVVMEGRYDIQAIGCWQPSPPFGTR